MIIAVGAALIAVRLAGSWLASTPEPASMPGGGGPESGSSPPPPPAELHPANRPAASTRVSSERVMLNLHIRAEDTRQAFARFHFLARLFAVRTNKASDKFPTPVKEVR